MQLTVPILIGIALADSINLVSFGILERLISVSNKDKEIDGTMAGRQYVIGFVTAYIFLGMICLIIFSFLGELSGLFFSVLGGIIFLLGLIELNKLLGGFSALNQKIEEPEARIKAYLEDYAETPSLTYILGVSTAIKETVYSGGFYLGLLGLLAIKGGGMDSYMIIFVYNLIVAIPLILVYFANTSKKKTKLFALPNLKKRTHMMLGIASLQTVLGIWLMFWQFV